jgi:hypothetical protein
MCKKHCIQLQKYICRTKYATEDLITIINKFSAILQYIYQELNFQYTTLKICLLQN